MRRPKVKLDNLIAIMTVAAKRNIDEAYFTQTHNADLAVATVASWRGVLVDGGIARVIGFKLVAIERFCSTD
jgi:hypothetical protein